MMENKKDNYKIDALNREDITNKIYYLINSTDKIDESLIFAIDGDWGVGKTFVLDMIEEKLKADTKIKAILFRYNPWEMDYYDEPVVGLVASLIEQLDKVLDDEECKKIKRIAKDVIKNVSAEGIRYISSKVFVMVTGIDLVSRAEDLGKKINGSNKEYTAYDQYISVQKAIKNLHKLFSELTLNERRIIFLIDEMDRCLPEYQIKVLERLHHIGLQYNMTILMAVNKRQLKQSITKIYGTESGSVDDYLRKIIQFTIGLDRGVINTDIKNRYNEVFNLYKDSPFSKKNPQEDRWLLGHVFIHENIRSIERILLQIKYIHYILFRDTKQYVEILYVEILCLILKKYKKYCIAEVDDYTDGISGDEKLKKTIRFLRPLFEKPQLIKTGFPKGYAPNTKWVPYAVIEFFNEIMNEFVNDDSDKHFVITAQNRSNKYIVFILLVIAIYPELKNQYTFNEKDEEEMIQYEKAKDKLINYYAMLDIIEI